MNLPGSLVFPVVAAAVYCRDDGVRRMILYDGEGGTFHFWGSQLTHNTTLTHLEQAQTNVHLDLVTLFIWHVCHTNLDE